MAKLNSYLNFPGNAEEAINFYQSVFGGELSPIMRYKDVADFPGKENLSETELNKVMHASLSMGDNMLMAGDMLANLGQHFKEGNNVTLSLHPHSKEEADELYKGLSEGGQPQMPMQDMFWGDYWGMLKDKFGTDWMINFHKE